MSVSGYLKINFLSGKQSILYMPRGSLISIHFKKNRIQFSLKLQVTFYVQRNFTFWVFKIQKNPLFYLEKVLWYMFRTQRMGRFEHSSITRSELGQLTMVLITHNMMKRTFSAFQSKDQSPAVANFRRPRILAHNYVSHFGVQTVMVQKAVIMLRTNKLW